MDIQYKIMKEPFVSTISAPDEIKKGKKSTFTIKGNWPTPNWSREKTEIIYDEKNKEVKVKYLGISAGGMALQVLKPFTDSIMIVFPIEGKWKVIVGSRGDNLEIEVEVNQ